MAKICYDARVDTQAANKPGQPALKKLPSRPATRQGDSLRDYICRV